MIENYDCSLVPRPIPSFSMLHAEKQEGLVSEVTWLCVTMTWRPVVKRLLRRANRCRPCAYSTSLFSYSLESKTIVEQSLDSFEDLLQADREQQCPEVCWPFACPHSFHPLTTLHAGKLGHVTSDTRPSRFSVYNIEKLGMGLGTRLLWLYISPWTSMEKDNYLRNLVISG